MAKPSALILSCANFPPIDIVKKILDCEELPCAKPIVDDIQSYPWHIDTKYYTADISLCTIEEKSIGNEEFCEGVQAVIVCFDSQKENSFSKVKEWMPFIKEYSAEVQLLVCDKCSENTLVKRTNAQEWCLQNNFELVEMDPEVDSDLDDDFPETTGVKRIIQALHAHLWPNMILKDKQFSSARLESLLDGEKKSDMDENKKEIVDTLAQKFDELASNSQIEPTLNGASAEVLDLDEADLMEMLGIEDPGGQSFETLFEQFRQMKETAKNLPFEARKHYAEKVAIAFWQAMGGDDEEIEGLENIQF